MLLIFQSIKSILLRKKSREEFAVSAELEVSFFTWNRITLPICYISYKTCFREVVLHGAQLRERVIVVSKATYLYVYFPRQRIHHLPFLVFFF